ncbi:sensor histidine kinase [Paenibacillus sp. GSMTC-2017]|uniref:ATP-binding protein n=1 Tax=Paenibacillus sp. GSMTC-2017 TaxID=2794350 RepID=UPI0018D9FD2A|nr:sensor histidine kinase [Paenibacillus sp. GSMTC-2017]MBH5319677.1 sensor histidine kinase [Paenibacillus sp. GSMTC-2017]
MRLQTRLILLIGSLLFVVIIALTFSFERLLVNTLEKNIGTSALKLAKTVALMDVIRDAFEDKDPSITIQPIVEKIRMETDAEYIVIGNKDGIRYAHPLSDRIGQKMVGGDNGPVLKGMSIISEAVGSMGPSLRGKTPIYNDKNEIIGIVSVGILKEDIEASAYKYRNRVILFAGIALLMGSLGAIWISSRVKRSIHGLEPKEIGLLYQEKKAILETIHEGIIAINLDGIVTQANHTAKKLIDPMESVEVTGQHIRDVVPDSRLLEVIQTGRAEKDQEMMINESVVVVNRLPIYDHQHRVVGAVSSFRNKSELLRLTEELTQVKRYTEALRAQTHEYSNKLYTIYGLIQLESYQEAMDLITHESNVHQNLIHFLMSEIPDPIVGGILIGKFNRANELKVRLDIDESSTFKELPSMISRNHLVTIIGNLIDNALDASLAGSSKDKWVKTLFSDKGDTLLIEVADSGEGISDEVASNVFELGFSTKKESNRGFGLAIVSGAVQQLGGTIRFRNAKRGGAIFTVVIPKVRGDYHDTSRHH